MNALAPSETFLIDGACIICNSPTAYFFSKDYPAFPGNPFDTGIAVHYHKCSNCGFVFSKTHQEMTAEQWTVLNSTWHHYFETTKGALSANQPPYADQALALTILGRNGLIKTANSLDYAAGFGTLSRFMSKYLNTDISIFDSYVQASQGPLRYVCESELGRYDLVINSAMFEHVLDRAALDNVNNLVSDVGVLMLHTVVCEKIPKDPNWFYLAPLVHSAFHTNKSMELLMNQWGYAASVYSPQAKSWFLFKNDHPRRSELQESIETINSEIQSKYFYFKEGFVDYWKGF